MTDMTKIHDESFRLATQNIMKPTLNAGGKDSDVMVVLESTITNVLLALNNKDARMSAGMLEEGLVPGVLERLSKYESDTNDRRN